MKKIEADATTPIKSWLTNVHKKTCAWEIKQTEKDSIAYSRLETHQERWLLAVSNNVASYKISDESIGHKPFDGFTFAKDKAYVIIYFKQSKTFYVITINNFVFYRDHKAKRKSLTEEEAKEIATYKVKIK